MSSMIIASVLLGISVAVYYLNGLYRRQFVKNFSAKYVFITGTDTGFGRKLAIELDKKGVSVFAGCYTKNGAEELDKIASNKLKTVSIDISDKNSIDEAKKFIRNSLPPNEDLWGLVNNAGVFGNVFFDFCTVEDFKNVMNVNFFGTIMVTEAFLPLIKKSRGRIVTVISVFGRGCCGIIPYCCSKFALEPYCDGLRRSMQTFGVHSAIIEPGYFNETRLTDESEMFKSFEKQWENLPQDTKTEYGEEFKAYFFPMFQLCFSWWPFVRQNRIEMVTDAMQHALGAKHPKARYLCGYDARGFVLFTNIMPDWILDLPSRFACSYHKVAGKA